MCSGTIYKTPKLAQNRGEENTACGQSAGISIFMIKCKDENVLEKLKKWYGLKEREINLEELKDFCKCSNLKFGVIQIEPNCDSMLLETERGSIKIKESGEIENGSGIYSQFAVEWYDVEMLERFLREDIKQIESGEKDLVCFGAPMLEV